MPLLTSAFLALEGAKLRLEISVPLRYPIT
jgi:hypothetical protein